MEKMNPVNAPSPVPRVPPAHRDRRKRQSDQPPKGSANDREDADNPRDDDDDNEHTIDEYA